MNMDNLNLPSEPNEPTAAKFAAPEEALRKENKRLRTEVRRLAAIVRINAPVLGDRANG